ncbi:hypothetical protein MUK42_06025 [Musa troglodytarum]|uniref:Uncharacterized protein n=1 Tax=Musa troglodytarum TaxID=320322 RepID=A0A9E7GH58_9LILI|nr:hypothetical protein MUK42_06025 [Musa troglodytarum]
MRVWKPNALPFHMPRNCLSLHDGDKTKISLSPVASNFFSYLLLSYLKHDLTRKNVIGTSSSSTDRVGDGCSKDDIVVHQGATPPLPSGIPTYTVVVLNLCPSRGGCAMAHIHLTCGAFSSARLVNPRIFRRLRVNDCLLNDGRPLPSGSSISFQYANSFSYPLAVSNASCIRSS